MLSVILFKVFSTLRGMKARYAGVVPVSVVRPGAVARVVLTPAAHASPWFSINALAQHALAADAASRRARSCVFQRQYLLQCPCHQSVAAPLKRNPLGGTISTPVYNHTLFTNFTGGKDIDLKEFHFFSGYS